jgi:hypothetical protein
MISLRLDDAQKKKLVALALGCTLLAGCAKPADFDPKSAIDVHGGGLSTRYEQQGQPIHRGQMQKALKAHEPSRGYDNQAQTWAALAVGTAAAGGGLIGWPLGTAAGGGEPIWALAAVGGGLVALSFPLAAVSEGRLSKAVRIYNRDLFGTSPSAEVRVEEGWQLSTFATQSGPVVGLSAHY